MNHEDLKQTIHLYASRSLEQRKHWYSPAAQAYSKVRPHYPERLIDQVVAIAHLPPNAKILEVGCGPATATLSFAKRGFSMLCLEPNPDFCQLAQQNCQSYPNVEIQNISFEEWNLETAKFDAVLAASSFHWIPAEIGYPKAAQALHKNGHLILLWNKELQPQYKIYQHLSAAYEAHAHGLNRYEDRETQENILRGLGSIIEDSEQFRDIVSGHIESQVTYTVDDYVTLLTTYSPYLKLDPQNRAALFKALRNIVTKDFGGRLNLSYLSAFHLAKKDSHDPN